MGQPDNVLAAAFSPVSFIVTVGFGGEHRKDRRRKTGDERDGSSGTEQR